MVEWSSGLYLDDCLGGRVGWWEKEGEEEGEEEEEEEEEEKED